MVRGLAIACCWILLSLASYAWAAENVDVILVAGQSNAVGFDASPGDLADDPIDAQVRFWWRCGDPPPDKHDSTSSGWTTLKPQPLGDPIKPRNGRQYGNFAQASGGFGPEIGLARSIASDSNTPLAIIKVAFSGTHVAGDWNPNLQENDTPVNEHDSHGACYRSLVAETKQALAELGPELEPRVVALVWVQGESDATAERAEEYQRNIGSVISSLRKDLQMPNMIALLGVNTQFSGGDNKHLADVIAAQKAYAETDARSRYVDTDGAAIANNVHFDAAGTIDVGNRFAKALAAIRSE